MAVAIPFLATLGGGSVAVGSVIAASAVAGIGSGVMGAVQARNAGIAADQAAKSQAKQEGDAARQREIIRRRDLLSALASQNATAGVQGVSVTGSKAAVAKQDIRYAAEDLLVDKVNTKRGIGIIKAGGKNARSAGNLGAAASLLDTAAKAGTTFGGGL